MPSNLLFKFPNFCFVMSAIFFMQKYYFVSKLSLYLLVQIYHNLLFFLAICVYCSQVFSTVHQYEYLLDERKISATFFMASTLSVNDATTSRSCINSVTNRLYVRLAETFFISKTMSTNSRYFHLRWWKKSKKNNLRNDCKR